MATPLLSHCKQGRTDRVSAAVDKDPTLLGYSDFLMRQTPWHVAARHGQIGVLTMLAERFQGLTSDPARTAILLKKMKMERPEDLKKLLDSRDRSGRTPLYVACELGNLEACRILLRIGSNYWAQDKKERTALHIASSNGHVDCAEEVISAAISAGECVKRLVNAITQCGHTPLHFAVMHGHHDTAKLLLRHEAGLHVHSILSGRIEDWGTAPGSTPLHFAAATGSRELIDILLGAQVARLGARLERISSGMPPASIDPRMLVNSIGQAPYHIAKNSRFDYLLEVLNPMMPLSDFFTGARSELLCAYGVLPLSTLAAAALQRHLLSHLDSIEQQGLYKRQQEELQQRKQKQKQTKQVDAVAVELPDTASAEDDDAGEATACIVITTRWQDKEEQQQGSGSRAASAGSGAATTAAGSPSSPSAAKASPAASDSTAAAAAAAAGALTGLAGILSTVSSISDNACSICLEEAPLVSIISCKHTLCVDCAKELCKRRALRPAGCPMCREVIPGFTL